MAWPKGEFFNPWFNSNPEPTFDIVMASTKQFKLEYLHTNA
jgi:hypothetical protein